jgi:hypothetical protein
MYTIYIFIEEAEYYLDKRGKISAHGILTDEAERQDFKEFNSIEEAVGFIYMYPELFSKFMENFPIEYVITFQINDENTEIQYELEGYWEKKFLFNPI